MGLPSIFRDITDLPDIQYQYFFNIKSIFLLIFALSLIKRQIPLRKNHVVNVTHAWQIN